MKDVVYLTILFDYYEKLLEDKGIRMLTQEEVNAL